MFQAGAARYAIAGAHVAEVLPAIVWTPVAGAAAGVIGIVNYHGTPVPLVDARVLLDGRAGEEHDRAARADAHAEAHASTHASARSPDSSGRLRLHSRILVVRPHAAADGAFVGVLVDRVLGAARHDPHEFADAGTVARGAPYLGPVLTDRDGVVQRIEPAQILPESVRDEVLRQWSGAA
jgi:chemotaxis-related protein WspB